MFSILVWYKYFAPILWFFVWQKQFTAISELFLFLFQRITFSEWAAAMGLMRLAAIGFSLYVPQG
jgi:hypothetical protein